MSTITEIPPNFAPWDPTLDSDKKSKSNKNSLSSSREPTQEEDKSLSEQIYDWSLGTDGFLLFNETAIIHTQNLLKNIQNKFSLYCNDDDELAKIQHQFNIVYSTLQIESSAEKLTKLPPVTLTEQDQAIQTLKKIEAENFKIFKELKAEIAAQCKKHDELESIADKQALLIKIDEFLNRLEKLSPFLWKKMDIVEGRKYNQLHRSQESLALLTEKTQAYNLASPEKEDVILQKEFNNLVGLLNRMQKYVLSQWNSIELWAPLLEKIDWNITPSTQQIIEAFLQENKQCIVETKQLANDIRQERVIWINQPTLKDINWEGATQKHAELSKALDTLHTKQSKILDTYQPKAILQGLQKNISSLEKSNIWLKKKLEDRYKFFFTEIQNSVNACQKAWEEVQPSFYIPGYNTPGTLGAVSEINHFGKCIEDKTVYTKWTTAVSEWKSPIKKESPFSTINTKTDTKTE